MSGGRFYYDEHRINDIAEKIQGYIERNGRLKTKEELKEEGWRDPDWYKKYPEDLKYYEYPPEVIDKLKEAVNALRKAYVYAKRADYLLSGDDSEASFLKRLQEELNKIQEL